MANSPKTPRLRPRSAPVVRRDPVAEPPLLLVGVTNEQACSLLRGRLRAFCRAGFHVKLVSGPGPLQVKTAEGEGVEAIRVPMTRTIDPLRDLVSLYRLWRMMRLEQPRLVEFSTPKAGLLGMIAARLCRVPLRVYLLRGLRLETTYGLKRRLLVAAERLAMRLAHVVLCNSSSLREQALELKLAPAGKLVLLGVGSSNGVNMDRFSPGPGSVREELGIGPGEPVLGFVGRFTRDKGVPELVEAFDLILKDEPRAWLLMVGWFDRSTDPLPQSVRERILAHPRILVTGQVESTAEYYRAMDLLALPTWREGFPNVVLEASATGIPVVTTESTGSRDSVLPEVTGLLIPPGYPEAIYESCLSLIRDPERRRNMGEAARAWVLAHYTERDVLRRTVEYYQSLITGRPPKVDRMAEELERVIAGVR